MYTELTYNGRDDRSETRTRNSCDYPYTAKQSWNFCM